LKTWKYLWMKLNVRVYTLKRMQISSADDLVAPRSYAPWTLVELADVAREEAFGDDLMMAPVMSGLGPDLERFLAQRCEQSMKWTIDSDRKRVQGDQEVGVWNCNQAALPLLIVKPD
jgi:hypothetical protein